MYADFTRMTFIDFSDELLSERNFFMDETIGESKVVRPDWPLCMVFSMNFAAKRSNTLGITLNANSGLKDTHALVLPTSLPQELE